jgi:DNA-binding NtrC family response regulator
VARGDFRRDLYFRLGVLSVDLPPLRDRDGDVMELVRVFTRRGLGDAVRPEDLLPDEVLAATLEYEWPGNVRELEALVRRACLFARMGKTLSVGMLPGGLRTVVEVRREAHGAADDVSDGEARGAASVVRESAGSVAAEPAAGAASGGPMRLDERLEAAERAAIEEALAMARGQRTRAADLLGISRRSLYRKMQRFGLG